MPTIISYKKYIDSQITRTLNLPSDASHHSLGTELATLADGLTYVSIPDGVSLPVDQPVEIAAGIVNPVTLTATQIAELKIASPHARLISQQMQDKIRATYSIEDEQFFSRIGVGVALGAYVFGPGEQADLLAFGAFVESVRQWGRAERTNLGL